MEAAKEQPHVNGLIAFEFNRLYASGMGQLTRYSEDFSGFYVVM